MPPLTATLNVTKLVTCEEIDETDSLLSVQQEVTGQNPTCANLEGNITENQFNITVTDTNVSPSNFNGSEAGTLVTLSPGDYLVNETVTESVAADLETLGGNITGPNITFTGDVLKPIPIPLQQQEL